MHRAPPDDRLRAAYRALRRTLLRARIHTLEQALADPLYGPCVRNLATSYLRRTRVEHDTPGKQSRLF